MEKIKVKEYESPFGTMILGSYKGKLCLCDWKSGSNREDNDTRLQSYLKASYDSGTSEVIEKAISELNEYFGGKRTEFDIPLLLTGTEFRNKVWTELMNIPYGTTISYAELARRIGNPKAIRAVASANAKNPISILVPCHRVIGSNNQLTGYAGGIEIKKSLIDLENHTS